MGLITKTSKYFMALFCVRRPFKFRNKRPSSTTITPTATDNTMASEKSMSKKEDEALLHKLSKATTVREFVSLLGVEMYAKNTDEDNITLADLKLSKMKDLQSIGFPLEDAMKILKAFGRLERMPKKISGGPMNIKSLFSRITGSNKKKVQFSAAEDTQIPIVYDPDDEPSLFDRAKEMPVNVRKGGIYRPTLLTASYVGDLQMVRTLLAHSANPDMQNHSGWTPLMYACQRGNNDVCRVLLDVGANMELRNNKGRTALMLAASWGHAKTVELLLWFSPRHSLFDYMNMIDNEGRTAMAHASLVNQSQCEEIFKRVTASSAYTASYPNGSGQLTPLRC